MQYEIPGFDPTSQQENLNVPFDVWHSEINHVKVHVVHPEEMYRRFETGQKITLVDYEDTSWRNNLSHVNATAQGGKNYSGQPVTIYEAQIDLRKEKSWKEPFINFVTNSTFEGLQAESFFWSNARLLRRPDSFLVMQAEIHNRSINLRNQTSSTNPNDPLKETRLSAPARKDTNVGVQLGHTLNCLSAMMCVAYSLGKDEIKSPSSTLIMTPNGPLYKNPDTGEYVHHLGREKIEVKASVPEKAPKPRHTFDQFFGIDHILDELRPLILFYTRPDLAAKWQVKRPGNVLFFGPAGTGKTQLAHALAGELNADLYELSSAEIYGKWLGDSEKAIKSVFDKVRGAKKPTILLLDEMDSIISIAENDTSGSRATNAVAGVFKTESASITEQNPNVILVATTNNPDRLDPALIRAGRFDLRIDVGLPNEHARAQIFGNLILNHHSLNVGEHEPDNPDKKATNFNPYDAELLDSNSLQELAALTDHDFSPADIVEVLRRAALAKANEEARSNSEPEAINLAFLSNIIAAMRRNRA